MEQENTAVQAIERIQARLKEEAEKRQKQLMRRGVPEKRTLAEALAAMTKQELDDIRYNVGLSGMSGLNKADTIEKLVPAVVDFARSWLVSLLDEQYQAFWHLANSGGISTQFRADEVRLDYFQSLGLMASGAHDGKLAWYLPQEILEEFQSLNRNLDFARAVELNTDALRMASGLLFYYGVMDYDALYARVCRHLEIDKDALPFADFMRVMFNGACWQKNIVAAEKVMFYYAVLDPNRVLDAQARIDVDFAKLSYGQVYDAGEENYIEATDAYKALAQFFMTAGGADVLRAAGIVGQITALLQNGRSMRDALAYIESELELTDEAGLEALPKLLIDFHSSLRMWELKGHTPKEIMTGKLDPEGGEILSFAAAQRRRGKAGRNDPCPCGSGKKYKNCCMRKDTGEA